MSAQGVAPADSRPVSAALRIVWQKGGTLEELDVLGRTEDEICMRLVALDEVALVGEAGAEFAAMARSAVMARS